MMMNKLLLTTAAIFFGASMAAHAVTLDFDSGTATYSGTNNLTGYSQDGFTFSVTLGGNDRYASGANLFDTNACASLSNTTTACDGNDDADLVPNANSYGVGGNVLIRQEAGATLDDDARGSGSITFTLTSGSAFNLQGFAAVDDGDFSISSGGSVLGDISLANDNDTGSVLFNTAALIRVGDSFTVNFGGSGGVDAISIAPVPLPAAAPMLLVGLGGLMALRRRNRKAA